MSISSIFDVINRDPAGRLKFISFKIIIVDYRAKLSAVCVGILCYFVVTDTEVNDGASKYMCTTTTAFTM